MTPFDNLLGKEIKNILRADDEQEYSFYFPIGILLLTAENSGLYFGAMDDCNSIDIEYLTIDELSDRKGIGKPQGIFINKLKLTKT